jgi:hypothetical protein
LNLASIALVLFLSASIAAAEPPQPQLQADLGLSVAAIGYEHPLGAHVSAMIGGGLFGTYFLPWFDLGDNVVGAVGDLRVTWFPRDHEHGIYVTPYVRAGYASGTHEDTMVDGAGLVLTTGLFIGYGVRLTDKLDLRVGAGGQYIYIRGAHDVGASTPFVALDTTLGFRL